MVLVLEGCSAIRVPDADRTRQLRRRHLALLLDGLAAGGGAKVPGSKVPGAKLPGPAPRPDEVNWRWHR
jgi:hypothetical protein